jgi:hypothetical protein
MLQGHGAPPQPRYCHIAVFDEKRNSLLITCGRGKDDFSDLHIYDISTSTWSSPTTSGDKPSHTEGSGGWLRGEHLWVFGGRRGFGEFSNHLHCLNVNSGVWQSVEGRGRAPSPRSYFVLWNHHNHTILFGGRGDDGHNVQLMSGETRKVEFKVGEIPSDMKMLCYLGGELSNAAHFFTTFARVSSRKPEVKPGK